MPLSCECDGDHRWFYEPPDGYETFPSSGRRKRCSCGNMIGHGETATRFKCYRLPGDEIEERIHGEDAEIPMADKWLCERCSDLFFSFFELGYECVSPDESMLELSKEYAGRGERAMSSDELYRKLDEQNGERNPLHWGKSSAPPTCSTADSLLRRIRDDLALRADLADRDDGQRVVELSSGLWLELNRYLDGKGASELKALLCALEAAGRDLLAWDAKYPKGTIYNHGEHTKCEAELTALVERFRELLAHND